MFTIEFYHPRYDEWIAEESGSPLKVLVYWFKFRDNAHKARIVR